MKHYLSYFRQQVLQNPDQSVLSDYKGTTTYTYKTMAEQMARLDILLTSLGVHAGEKVALCGRNSANWGVAFFALAASKRVSVSILPDFTPDGIRDLINHSEAKIFFAGELVWKRLNEANISLSDMPSLVAIISNVDFSPLALADEALQHCFTEAEQTYQQRYPQGLCDKMLAYPDQVDDDLAMINYTSGTTSSPKGVMLSTRSICSNIDAAFYHVHNSQGQQLVSILPMAHMYGLTTEFIFQVCGGVHLHFLMQAPTPKILQEAMQDVHPYMIVCVPLVIEKIFRARVIPMVNKPWMRIALATPLLGTFLKKKIVQKVCDALGGKIGNYMIGGAALNQEVEMWMKRLGMPYLVGYGMTECGPLIAYEDCDKFVPTSCGKAVNHMEIRIDSEDPERIPGEIQTKGDNLMIGYYKNEEATRAIFTEDGWLRTGDLGIMDREGNVFIKGRSKNMILGPSGQNIYPEEIEDKLNSTPGIAESIIVEREGKLVALVYADPIYIRRLSRERVEELINRRLKQINRNLPAYSQIKNFEFVQEEFEKTPKRSIKRFLYK